MEDVIEKSPILHVIVVGFHHKKGCQAEYCFPPLENSRADCVELPEQWKHLPSLALPDGAHNFSEDTIFFHLPALTSSGRPTIFGVSCYRQMSASDLEQKSAEVTRGTVQKSVCVLSHLPLYGLIAAKLELITHAYFDEKDFSKVALLEQTFNDLNCGLKESLLEQGPQAFLGLSPRTLVRDFRHKALVLFKLLLLERRVVFYAAPVKRLSCTIATILSLFSGMLEHGLSESASFGGAITITASQLSGTESLADFVNVSYSQVDSTDQNNSCVECGQSNISAQRTQQSQEDGEDTKDDTNQFPDDKIESKPGDSEENGKGKETDASKVADKDEMERMAPPSSVELGSTPSPQSTTSPFTPDANSSTLLDEDELLNEIDQVLNTGTLKFHSCMTSGEGSPNASALISDIDREVGQDSSQDTKLTGLKNKLYSVWNVKKTRSPSVSPSRKSKHAKERQKADNKEERLYHPQKSTSPCVLAQDSYGQPLEIFTKGSLCHPYLSLAYLDMLTDVNVRAFVVGATNILFVQKQYIADVVVTLDEEGGHLEIRDHSLAQQLQLTTEDLRFADFLIQSVTDQETDGDIFLDGTGWEGGDEWLRAQFRLYLLALLAANQKTKCEEEISQLAAFNMAFVNAWRATHNFRVWNSNSHESMEEIEAMHPCEGNLSLADMRIRWMHTMQNSERAKRLNAAVTQTGKAVGSAITQARSVLTSSMTGLNQAKGTFSSWISHLPAYLPSQKEAEQPE